MSSSPLDDVDRAILHVLQEDARTSPTEIARQVDVSGNTVRNRIEKLEDAGIIEGYRVMIDYNPTNLHLHFLFVCDARVSDREAFAEEALDVPGVLQVRTLMTGRQNVHVEALGTDNDDITRIALALDEIGLEVVTENLIKREANNVLDHFLADGLTDSENNDTYS